MHLRTLLDEDFVNYKVCSMFICMPFCNFKCNNDAGEDVCQNESLIHHPMIEMKDSEIIKRYLDNPLSKAIVLGGLEPFYSGLKIDSAIESMVFIIKLRERFNCYDPVVIYTGYTEHEITNYVKNISNDPKLYGPVIIKFGRFVPNKPSRYDDILGITLASDNQYAKAFNM